MTAAALVLEKLDVDLNAVRLAVETNMEAGHADAGAKLPTPRRAKNVFEYAVIAARQFDCRTVGTEHLLLGLLREPEGVAPHVLANFGVKPDDITSEILNVHGPDGPLEATAGHNSFWLCVATSRRSHAVICWGAFAAAVSFLLRACPR